MKPLAKHLTPEEVRTLWILTAVVLLGIGGRIRIASHPGGTPQAPSSAATTAAPTP
jgi:hypothetical protein